MRTREWPPGRVTQAVFLVAGLVCAFSGAPEAAFVFTFAGLALALFGDD